MATMVPYIAEAQIAFDISARREIAQDDFGLGAARSCHLVREVCLSRRDSWSR